MPIASLLVSLPALTGTWTAPTGQHTLTATATYAGGISATSAPVTVTVIAGASVSVAGGSWNPPNAYVGDMTYGGMTATMNPPSLDSDGSGLTYVTYHWETNAIWESDDGGVTIPWSLNTGNSIITWMDDLYNPQFWGAFLSPGYYILKAKCTASIHDSRTGVDILDVVGYSTIGGPDPSATVAAPSARQAGVALGHAATVGGKLIDVKVRIWLGGKDVTDKTINVTTGSISLIAQLKSGAYLYPARYSGSWSIPNVGSPVASWTGFEDPAKYGMVYTYDITPISSTSLGNPTISYIYTKVATGAQVSYSTLIDGKMHTASVTINIVHAKPLGRDITVFVHPYYHNLFGNNVSLPWLTMNIPPAQADFPWTAAPNVKDRISNAAGRADFLFKFPSFKAYLQDVANTGSIGDWGKTQRFWPDIPVVGSTIDYNRRIAANFNLGAMCDSADLTLPEALAGAQYNCWKGSGGHFHPSSEQLAIEAGYYWDLWGLAGNISDKSKLSIYIPWENH